MCLWGVFFPRGAGYFGWDPLMERVNQEILGCGVLEVAIREIIVQKA